MAVMLLVGHEVFGKLAVGDSDIAAGDGRHLAVAATLERLVAVVDNLDAFVGAHPEVAILILHESRDSVGGEFAAVIGVHTGHEVLPIVDIDDVATATEPLEAGDAVADELVDFGSGHHRHRGELLPGAVGAAHGKGMGAVGVEHPQVALTVEGHSAGVQTAIGARSVGNQSATSGGGIIKRLHLVVADGSQPIAPEGGHQLVSVAGIDSHIDEVGHAVEHPVALVEETPLASHGGEQIGGEIGVGIGRRVATRTEHHTVVERHETIGVVGRGRTLGAVVFFRPIPMDSYDALPLVGHPECAVGAIDGIVGYKGTPIVGTDCALIGHRGIIGLHFAVGADGQIATACMKRLQLAGIYLDKACAGFMVDVVHVGHIGVAGCQQMAADGRHFKDILPVEAVVDIPTVADGRMGLITRQAFETFASGRIDAIGQESQIINRGIGSAGSEIPSFFDFLTVDVHHHHAESGGEIGPAVGKTHVVDALVARNLATLDVGKVEGMTVDNEVDIRVVVGHHQAFGDRVVVQRRDAHIAQSVALAETCEGVVVEIIAEDPITGAGIDAIAGMGHMVHPRVVETVAPMTDGGLGRCGIEKRKKKNENDADADNAAQATDHRPLTTDNFHRVSFFRKMN